MPRSFPPSRAAERRCRPRGKLRPKAEKQFLKTLAQVIGPLRRRKTRGFPTFRAHEKRTQFSLRPQDRVVSGG